MNDGVEIDKNYTNSYDTTLNITSSTPTNEEKMWNHLRKALDLAKLDQDEIGDYTNAIKELDNAISLNPNFVKAYHYKGLIYDALNNANESMYNINYALSLDSLHIPSYFAKSYFYTRKEDYQNALNAINKIIEIDPKNGKAYNRKGLFKVKFLNKKEEGCKDLKKAADLGFSSDGWQILCD